MHGFDETNQIKHQMSWISLSSVCVRFVKIVLYVVHSSLSNLDAVNLICQVPVPMMNPQFPGGVRYQRLYGGMDQHILDATHQAQHRLSRARSGARKAA
jgi:hypothetical protein